MGLDIHSHILPGVDDGAKNTDESLQLLRMMQRDGSDRVIATPHFYPEEMNLADFLQRTDEAKKKLRRAMQGKKLPEVFFGCELLYYSGCGYSEELSQVCLNQTGYLLLELVDSAIHEDLFDDIDRLRTVGGMKPVIAHVERYYRAKQYKKLLAFLEKEKVPVQINAASVIDPPYKRVVKRLLSRNLFVVLASDAHSPDGRPPRLTEAFAYISQHYGADMCRRLRENERFFEKELIGESL